MNEAEITQLITTTFEDVHPADAWGDTFFFYNPDRQAPDEFYFATLKSKDDEGDRASALDRPGIFRLNIGVSKESYRALFGAPAARNGATVEPDTISDFAALDQLLPHPVYGRMHWISVLNPSAATIQRLQPLLNEAYELAVRKYAKRAARADTPTSEEEAA